jgi:hypothetical protein
MWIEDFRLPYLSKTSSCYIDSSYGGGSGSGNRIECGIGIVLYMTKKLMLVISFALSTKSIRTSLRTLFMTKRLI